MLWVISGCAQNVIYVAERRYGKFPTSEPPCWDPGVALLAGAPDRREQGGGGVQKAWSRPQIVPKGRSELYFEREGGQAMGEAVIMMSS